VSRTEFTPAVVLRSVAYGDADRIVTLLTESRGKVALIARSARKSTRRFGAALEPCALIEAEIAMGKGDLGRLATARVLRAFPGLLSDLSRIGLASAGLELVREAIDDRDPDARLIPAVEQFFEVLETHGTLEVLLAFSVRILALTGHAPNVETCGRCGRPAPAGKAAHFDPAGGAIVCRACGGGPMTIGGSVRARITRAATRSWVEEAAARWTERERTSARELLSEVERRHLPRELSGLDLVAQVREVIRG
jgi:DNA repair protein RecO (recombination protein O)